MLCIEVEREDKSTGTTSFGRIALLDLAGTERPNSKPKTKSEYHSRI